MSKVESPVATAYAYTFMTEIKSEQRVNIGTYGSACFAPVFGLLEES